VSCLTRISAVEFSGLTERINPTHGRSCEEIIHRLLRFRRFKGADDGLLSNLRLLSVRLVLLTFLLSVKSTKSVDDFRIFHSFGIV